jgi:hypothetical protein
MSSLPEEHPPSILSLQSFGDLHVRCNGPVMLEVLEIMQESSIYVLRDLRTIPGFPSILFKFWPL